MPKRKRAAAVKSGYAGTPLVLDLCDTIATSQPTPSSSSKKARKTRSSPSVPSSPVRTRSRLSARNTIDDVRTSKQTHIADMRQSSSVSNRQTVLRLPDDVLYHMISFLVCPARIDEESFSALQSTCKRFNELCNSAAVWNRIPLYLSDGRLNLQSLGLMKLKSQGTEGTCFQVRCRRTRRVMALKRARVYPDNEGVPYYMMRELSALKKLNHPNICELEVVSLHNFKLYLLFPYTERTLHDYINPEGSEPVRLKASQTQHIMSQLLAAVAYCHERCIMHRNLKPKHLLITPGPGMDPLDNCTVKLADFALVRVLVHPPRQYTTEVITLWYRPPEILLGQRNYSTAVDVWSIGCIFAELMEGRPLFAGVCEIDQLFQIFNKMGTPSEDVWPKYPTLPHFQNSLFPNWEVNQLLKSFKRISDNELNLLLQFLRYDPASRITAKEALQHRYFSAPIDPDSTVDKTSDMVILSVPPPGDSCSSSSTVVIGRSRFASAQLTPLFAANSKREVNFDISQFESIDSVDPMVLRQYLYLRHLEQDDIYDRPYFGRTPPTEGPLQTSNLVNMRRSSSGSAFDMIMRLGFTPAGNITSGDVDVVCIPRMELVDSLIDIMDSISVHMCTRTVFFAVSIFDRYLSLCEKPREDMYPEYELIGSTCLHIASKCEDVSYISVKDLAYASRNIGDGTLILKMEELVLNKLNFDLYIPAVIDFVGFFVECIPQVEEGDKAPVYARYLSELSLMFPCFLTHPASLVGTAIVAYSLLCCGQHPWPQSLESLSMYPVSSVMDVVKKLNRMHSRVFEVGFHSIFERYSSGLMPFDVALLDPPVLPENAVDSFYGVSART